MRDGVDEEAQGMLRRAGINCYRRFDKEDLHRLSEITGATIVRSIETAESVHLGHCDSWEERKVSGVHYLHIFSNYGRGRTLIVRGSTSALRDEVIRTFDDALGVAVRVSGKAPMLPGGDQLGVTLHACFGMKPVSIRERGNWLSKDLRMP